MLALLFLLPVFAEPTERWSDETNASSSEGNMITCTWGILCSEGYTRQGDKHLCQSNFECVPTNASNMTNLTRSSSEVNVTAAPISLRSQPFYQPFREGTSIWNPNVIGRQHRIKCPCGVRCRWGYHYQGLRRVCKGAVECGICYGR